MLTSFIDIFGLRIGTSGLFFLLSLLFASYVIWREAKTEGFNEEQVFDAIVVVISGGLFMGRVVYGLENLFRLDLALRHALSFWVPGLNVIGAVCGGFLIGYIWVKKNNWSIYRIVDIFSLGFTFALPVFLVSEVLIKANYSIVILCGFLILLHAALLTLRRKNFVFGGIFSLTLMLVSPVLVVFYYDVKSLIFAAILFIVGSVELVVRLRGRKKMISPEISKDFLNNIKKMLTRKDKELAREERLVDKEDSFTVPGRDTLNTEFEDEAKEDEEHEKASVLKKSISEMRFQVKKALARINIGTYGICEICHKPIDPARLKFFPQATTCVECEDKKR